MSIQLSVLDDRDSILITTSTIPMSNIKINKLQFCIERQKNTSDFGVDPVVKVIVYQHGFQGIKRLQIDPVCNINDLGTCVHHGFKSTSTCFVA